MAATPGLALADSSVRQTYTCDGGGVVDATYLIIGETALVVLTVESRRLAFDAAVRASGARYIAMDKAQP